MIRWTYCTKEVPDVNDVIVIARIINYSKRRMWSILNEPYGNGFEDDAAHEAIDAFLHRIETLQAEYELMVTMYGPAERIG
jgi:hypothetical protein